MRALAAHDGLVASADGACVRLWSVEGRKRILTLKAQNGRAELHGGGVTCLDIDADQLLSGGGDGASTCMISRRTRFRVDPRTCCRCVSDCLLLRVGARAVSSDTTGCVRLWDAAGAGRRVAAAAPGLMPVPLSVSGERLSSPRPQAFLFDLRRRWSVSLAAGTVAACCFSAARWDFQSSTRRRRAPGR